VRHIRFTDDNFTASEERLRQVCGMMIEEDLPFGWSSFARPDAITGEIAALMNRSGCEFLEMGIESGNDGMLRRMGKGFGIDTAKKAIDHVKGHGIDASGAFILGYPGETEETIQQTIDLINQSGLSYYRLNFFYYSGSMLLHRQRGKHGMTGLGWAWKHNTIGKRWTDEHLGNLQGPEGRGLPPRDHIRTIRVEQRVKSIAVEERLPLGSPFRGGEWYPQQVRSVDR
jgi:hypothetical protein